MWWHSVDGDTYTYVDGKVEAGKSYMANVRVVSSGSTTLAISSLTKVTVKWDDGTDAEIAKQELLETGSDILSIDTVPITVESTQVASGVQASAVTGVSASLQGASVGAGLGSAASASAANATADIAVKCTDTALYAKGEAHWSDSFTVTGKVGQSLTITPAVQEGRQFDHWEWADAPKGCDLTAYELTIPSLKAAMSGKITAVYAPVISELSVEGLSVPTKVGQELSADVTSIKAKAGGSGDVGLTDLTSYFVGDSGKGAVSWSPNDTVTAADTAYTAAILIDSTAAKNGVKYVLADDVDVYVLQDGEKCKPWWSCIEDGIFCVGFWPTEKFELQGVKDTSTQLSYEEAYKDQAAADVAGYDVCAFALPEYALVSVSAQGLGDAAATLAVPVEWMDTPKLDTSKKEAQTLMAHGKVTLPDEVDQNGKSLDVTMTIEVAAPVKVATPKASVASGTYDAAQWVYLSCDSDDVTLRYTLDGSEPTARSQAYTGFPLMLDSSTQLRVVAVSNDSDAASDVASYDYTIDAVTRTITLDTGAGSKLEPMKVVNGAWAYPDEEPVLEGYRFVGWKLDGDWFLFYTPVTSDITLTAVWEDARPSVADAKVTLSKAKLVYSGKKQAPSLKSVIYNGTKLKQGTDYKIKIVKGKKVGAYTVRVTGMGDYQGTTSASYRIVPAKVKGVSSKAAGKHKAKVSWKAHKAQTTGFKVRWAASAKALKQGKAVKTALVKKVAATSCTVKGLQSGKKAYVQVRAYKVVDGKKIWSSWSKAVSVKVK